MFQSYSFMPLLEIRLTLLPLRITSASFQSPLLRTSSLSLALYPRAILGATLHLKALAGV